MKKIGLVVFVLFLANASLFGKNILDEKEFKKAQLVLSKIDRDTLVFNILEKTKGTIPGKILSKFPKLTYFIADLIKDKHALPGLHNILKQKKKILIYLVIVFISFLINWLMKKKLKQNVSFIYSFFRWWARLFFMTGIRLGSFIYLFQIELTPLWHVMKKSFTL